MVSPVAALFAGAQLWRIKTPRRLLALFVCLLIGLALARAVPAAPVVAEEGPRSDVTTITCKIDADGATTCAVTQGAAAICALRKGQDIRRSYRAYDYLDQPPGCALGLDYWRTHAPGGPANYDETWDRVGPDGPQSAFFGSPYSFTDMLGPETSEESPYRSLARVYVASELNRIRAPLPESVQAAQDEATVLLLASPSGEFDAATAERGKALTAVLSAYLAGGSGPGLCAVMTEPFGPEDVGKTLVGVESEDSGTILRVEEKREKPGEGVVSIGPLTAQDQFILADEAFTVEAIRKGRFTQETNDCVVANSGEEVAVAAGGLPGDPTAVSALMRQLARNLQVMIALNAQTDTSAPAPSAGPTGPAPGGDVGGDAGSQPGGAGGFPTGALPPIGSGGSDLIPVPNLIGLTEGQASGRLTSVRLRLGSVTTVSTLLPSGGSLVATAYAQECQELVVSQNPSPGTLVPAGTPVSVDVSDCPEAMPEPSSLPMIAVAFAVLGLLLWRGGRLGASGAAILLIFGTLGCDSRAVEERMSLAKQFMDAGRPNGAVVELKKAIQVEPDNAAARVLLGKAYFGLGRLADAEKELARAAALRPGDPMIVIALGQTWLRLGNYARLLSELRPEPVWADREEALAWSLRGQAELAAGTPGEALGSFQSAQTLDPTEVEPLIGIIRAAARLDREEEAQAALNRAVALAPEDPALLALVGHRAFRSGDYVAAEDAFRRLLKAAPDSLGARLDLAQALLAQNRDLEAAVQIDGVLTSAPEHPDAHYLAALVSLRAGDFAAVNKHARAALQVQPRQAPSRALAAFSAAELGHWTEARIEADTLKILQPDHPFLPELQARIDEATSPATSEPAANQARPLEQDLALFRLDPVETPGLVSALAALERDDPESRAAFEHALANAPASWTARGAALADFRSGRALRARLSLQTWLTDHPDDAETRGVLCDLLLLEGEFAEALPHLRSLAAQRPRDAVVLNNLAWALSQLDELHEARIWSERALALAPHDPRAMDTQGLILLQGGDAKGAAAILRRAAGSEAAPPETAIRLAQALIRSGDAAGAREVLMETLAAPEATEQHRAAAILLQSLEP